MAFLLKPSQLSWRAWNTPLNLAFSPSPPRVAAAIHHNLDRTTVGSSCAGRRASTRDRRSNSYSGSLPQVLSLGWLECLLFRSMRSRLVRSLSLSLVPSPLLPHVSDPAMDVLDDGLVSHLVQEGVKQLDLSTPEARWQWYRVRTSPAPDLSRFPVSLPGDVQELSNRKRAKPVLLLILCLRLGLRPCWWNLRSLPLGIFCEPVAARSLHVPQLVENVGKLPKRSANKFSQQMVDNPAPKMVKKKRAVAPRVVSASSSSFSPCCSCSPPGA